MVSFTVKGDWSKTNKFFNAIKQQQFLNNLEAYGRQGVAALEKATPVDTGKTASSWNYKIIKTRTGISIEWDNTNIQNGLKIAILIQYGHGTKNGGYVKGRDYINPAMQPLFDEITEKITKEVSAL